MKWDERLADWLAVAGAVLLVVLALLPYALVSIALWFLIKWLILNT